MVSSVPASMRMKWRTKARTLDQVKPMQCSVQSKRDDWAEVDVGMVPIRDD